MGSECKNSTEVFYFHAEFNDAETAPHQVGSGDKKAQKGTWMDMSKPNWLYRLWKLACRNQNFRVDFNQILHNDEDQ